MPRFHSRQLARGGWDPPAHTHYLSLPPPVSLLAAPAVISATTACLGLLLLIQVPQTSKKTRVHAAT